MPWGFSGLTSFAQAAPVAAAEATCSVDFPENQPNMSKNTRLAVMLSTKCESVLGFPLTGGGQKFDGGRSFEGY